MGSVTTDKRARPWYRLHASTYAVLLLTATVLFFLNVPGQYVPYVGTPLEEDFPDTRLARDRLEHGWPLAYLIRDNRFFVDRSGEAEWRATKVWSFTEDLISFHAWSLLCDITAAIGVLAIGVAATEFWRRQRRSIWQLRISDLLGLTAVFGVGIWYGLTTVREYNGEIATMQKLGIHLAKDGVYYPPDFSFASYGGPTWLHNVMEDQFPPYFDRLAYADTPELDIELLSTFKHLRAISVTAKPGPRLASLAQLEQLEGVGMVVDTDDALDSKPAHDLDRDLAHCLASFAEMPNLTVFRAEGTGFGDRSARIIARFPRLRVLYLSSTSTSDEGMRAIGQCNTIEELYIDYAEISAAALAHLQSLTNLRILELRSCRLAETAFEQLGRLLSLQQLRLSTTDGVRGSDLHKLANLKELESLIVPSDIDRAALEDLQRSLPGLRIKVGDEDFMGDEQ